MSHIPYYYQGDIDYAHKRLSATYVLTKSESLFYIHAMKSDSKNHFAEGVKIGFSDKINMDESWFGLPLINLPVTELNLAPLELGYVFSKKAGKAVHISRYPMRNIFKQGLHLNALAFSDGGSKGLVTPDELLMPVFNRYPSVKEAFELAEKSNQSFPFSRAFAVKSNGDLEYLGKQVVGKVLKANNRAVPVLSPKHIFLQQHLDWSTK